MQSPHVVNRHVAQMSGQPEVRKNGARTIRNALSVGGRPVFETAALPLSYGGVRLR